jgi:uncharacterized membrane protein YtjA (UPF0391 family)
LKLDDERFCHRRPVRQMIADRALRKRRNDMLRMAVVFLIIALIAGVLGASGAAFIASEIAWILFVLFLILFVVALVMGRSGGPTI